MVDAFGPAIIGVSLFVFVAILIGFLIHRIICWYLEGAISGATCVILITTCVLAVALIISVPDNTIRVTLIFVSVLSAFAAWILIRRQDKNETSAFYREKIKEFRSAIESDPRNLAARSYLVDALYKDGYLDEAIDELKELVRLSPSSTEDSYKLHKFEKERDERKTPTAVCPSCGRKNPADSKHCYNCGNELSAAREIKKWLSEGGLRQIVVTSSIATGVCTVVLFSLSILPIPLRIGIVAVILLVVIISFVVHIQRNW